MQLSEFDYELPKDRIAQTPAEPRDSAKLLCLDKKTGDIDDKVFRDIGDMLGKNDVLVVNETKVINARLKGRVLSSTQHLSPTLSCQEREQKNCSPFLLAGERIQDGGVEGGKYKNCEIFLHKQISENTWDCLVYPGKKLKPGTRVVFMLPSPCRRGTEGEVLGEIVLKGTVQSISEKGRYIKFSHSGQEFLDIVEEIGETPLPPYIKDHSSSPERYQTVYHDYTKSGSVAAPTAGLHFTPELLGKLKNKGVKIEKVLLHVGIGTFGNVEVEDIKNHKMHSEYAEIDKDTAERLNDYKSKGKRIIAVGTTSVRTLESFVGHDGQLGHGSMETDIFIYPGYEWKFVESIITNFHLPKSTLLMLVSSFAGQESIKKAYQHAVDSQYRFFSFGDAMWIA